MTVFSMINSVPQFNSGLDPECVATTVRTATINALPVPPGTV
ncbi:hypothetical protein [Streptomyces formicae]|nr:hypothetical protein [Streptomyces formicae]